MRTVIPYSELWHGSCAGLTQWNLDRCHGSYVGLPLALVRDRELILYVNNYQKNGMAGAGCVGAHIGISQKCCQAM